MVYKKIQLPREVHIGPDIIGDIGKICSDLRFNNDALIVCGDTTYKLQVKLLLIVYLMKDLILILLKWILQLKKV